MFGCRSEIATNLRHLEAIGEAYHLGKGFWCMGQERNVPFGDEWFLISPEPTSQLSNRADLIDTEALARFSESPLEGVENQSLLNWLKIPGPLLAWHSALLENLENSFVPSPLIASEIEVYFPRGGRSVNRSKFWVSGRELGHADYEHIFLAKHTTIGSRYLWVKLTPDGVFESNAEVTNVRRTRYAIERQLYSPKREMKLSRDLDTTRLESFFRLPHEEERLIGVGGRIEYNDTLTRYYIPSRHLVTYLNLFEDLGIQVR